MFSRIADTDAYHLPIIKLALIKRMHQTVDFDGGNVILRLIRINSFISGSKIFSHIFPSLHFYHIYIVAVQ